MESPNMPIDNVERTEASIKGLTGDPMNISYQDSTTQETIQYNALDPNELMSIVNVTREYPFDYATIMFGYMMPFVLVLTLITNTLVVMVLFQRHMRTPTNIVLFTMAIVDLATLLSPSPWYFYIYTLGYYDKFLYPPLACYVHHVMTDVIPVFFHTSSIWLALLLASQRYIYVCHPTLARTWCTVPRVRKAIIIIIVVAFLHQVTRFFDNTFKSIEVVVEGMRHPACKIEMSDWVSRFYFSTYYTFRILFVFIIPCVALITLNCLLFRALRRAENKRTELLKTKFKLIGGEQCSVAGFNDIKRPSFVSANCNNQQIANEVSSTGYIMANSNKRPSTSALIGGYTNKIDQIQRDDNIKQGVNNGNLGDKSRKFSITLLRTASKQTNHDTSDTACNLIKISSPANNHISDTKVICSAIIDQDLKNSNITHGLSQQSMRVSKRRSEGSSDSCSVGSSQSRSDCALNSSRSKLPQRNDHFRDKRSVDEIDSADSGDVNYEEDAQSDRGEEDEEEFTCLECATCEADSDCQRCSGAIREGTTSGKIHCHRHAHQPMSQCSSLVEGATNTTTNDDDGSSCAIAHNASSSMYVIHNGNLEIIENSSMREGSEENLNTNDNRDNTSLQNIEPSPIRKETLLKQMTNDTKETLPLSRGDSGDSRLTCGCLISRSTSSRRGRQSSGSRRSHCRECCVLKNQCNNTARKNGHFQRDASFSASRKLVKSRQPKCAASCSNSDPCINCNTDTYPNNATRCGINGEEHENGVNNLKPTLPTSQSDYASANADDPYEASSKVMPTCTNATTTTTTTTTTLYSTKTNSVGSLLQVQNHSLQANSAKGQQTAQLGTMGHSAHIKSPSIASATTGRGSRATIGGVGPPISTMPGAMTSTVTASSRTMDSNRTTLMLIVVVTVFLMVEVPVAISHILHVVFNSFEIFEDIEFASSLNYIKLFTNFFIMISYSVNFTIYCSMSKKFRETFRDLFMCGKRAKRKRAKRLLYLQQQQQQQSQYTQHQFNIQETQLIANVPEEINNTPIHTPAAPIPNDFATTTGGLNCVYSSAGVLRYSPYKKASNQPQKCEL